MQLIKDSEIIDNTWTFITDDSPIPEGDNTVSIKRWLADKSRLSQHSGKLGLRIETEDRVEDIAQDLANFQLIELNFPAFTDGRAFSHARLLRNQYHYAGEIRAVGGFLSDQVFYLSRVGINAFALQNQDEIPVALKALNDFSVTYQASSK